MSDLGRQMQLARFKHNQLFTKQLRVRHLQSISLRNFHPVGHNIIASSIEHLFFTILVNHCGKDVQMYESEHIKPSVNLAWQPFQLTQESSYEDCLAAKVATVRFWLASNNKIIPFLDFEVHLSGLVCLSQKATMASTDIFPPVANSIVFGLCDGLYIAASVEPSEDGRFNATASVIDMEADFSLVKSTYKLQTLSRLQTLLRALKQTQVKVNVVRQSIEKSLTCATNVHKKREEAQLLKVRTKVLQHELLTAGLQLQALKEQRESLQKVNQQYEVQFREKNETFNGEYSLLKEKKKLYQHNREELLKTGAQLVMRKKQLINDLATIYPIDEVESKKEYVICGVPLAASENFEGCDDLTVSVALGYVCHMLSMLSVFLDMPLRYPVSHLSSRSLIHDFIDHRLDDKEREFCLFGKNRDKLLFAYAVFLLNKNIAQLRCSCGMNTSDLRQTLHNLKSLLELRLGVTRGRPTRVTFTKANTEQITNGKYENKLAISGQGLFGNLSENVDKTSSNFEPESGSHLTQAILPSNGEHHATGTDHKKSKSLPLFGDSTDSNLTHNNASDILGREEEGSQDQMSMLSGEREYDASSSEGSGTYLAQFSKLWSASKDAYIDENRFLSNLGHADPTFLCVDSPLGQYPSCVDNPCDNKGEKHLVLTNSNGAQHQSEKQGIMETYNDMLQKQCDNVNMPLLRDSDANLSAADNFLERTSAIGTLSTFQLLSSHTNALNSKTTLTGQLDASIE